MVCDLFGRPDPADAAAVDLHEADISIIDDVASHEPIMRRLAAGERNLPAYARKPAVSFIGASMKWLLQPTSRDLLEQRNAQDGSLHVVPPYLARVDEELAIRPQPFARGHELVGICLERAAAERSPAAFDGAEPCLLRLATKLKRLLRCVAEKL